MCAVTCLIVDESRHMHETIFFMQKGSYWHIRWQLPLHIFRAKWS